MGESISYRRGICWTIVVMMLACAFSAQAASLSVTPIRIFLTPENPVISLEVENQGQVPMLVQSETLTWKQVDYKSVYAATTDLIISPPIFEVAAGATQIVRLTVNGVESVLSEETFRVFLTEVPLGKKETADSQASLAIQVNLRLGLPVFVTPKNAVARLRWTIEDKCAGGRFLVAENTGEAHTRVFGISVLDKPGGKIVTESKQPRYILRGAKMQWPIALAPGEIPEQATLKIDFGMFRVEPGLIDGVSRNCG